MCSILLVNILNDNIKIDDFINWLKNEKIEEDIFSKINCYECGQTEFVNYLVNYINDEITNTLTQHTTIQQTYRNPFSSNVNIDIVKSKETITDLNLKKEVLSHNLGQSVVEQNEKDTSNNQKFINNSTNDFQVSSDNASTPKKKSNVLNVTVLNTSISPIKTKHYSLDSNTNIANKSNTKQNSTFCLGDFIVKQNKQTKRKTKITPVDGKFDENKKFNDDSLSENVNFNISDSRFNRRFSNNENFYNKEFKKRINPTKIEYKREINPTNNSNFVNCTEQQSTSKNFNRQLLQAESKKISEHISQLQKSDVKNIVTKSVVNIEPNINLVTNTNQLDILLKLVFFITENNLYLNICSLLKLSLSVVLTNFQVIKKSSDNPNDIKNLEVINENDNLFKSLHNCVYFSCHLLLNIFIKTLLIDDSIIKFARNNNRLKQFAPNLVLTSFKLKTKLEKTFKNDNIFENEDIDVSNHVESVLFASETDTRENFPSDVTFQAFKKQRDMFYEILEIWENKHFVIGWKFQIGLSGRVRSLLGLCLDPVNYLHFAKLFMEQLLGVCGRNKNVEENEPIILNSLPNLDADRLLKLENRFKIKTTTDSNTSENDFIGHEEFYKEFILAGSSPQFEKHLVNVFKKEIEQLNNTIFYSSEVEDCDTSVDISTKKIYVSCLKKLNILAKFLGFLESKSFLTDYIPKGKIYNSQFELRRHYTPPVNISEIIEIAIHNGKLIISIPWVVKFISMLDYITLRVPYFTKVYENLFEIYHKTNISPNCQNVYNAILLKYSLSWLFERPFFPQELYFKFITNKYTGLLLPVNTQIQVEKTNYLNKIVEVKNNNCEDSYNTVKIDELDLLDKNILYISCPFLNEIKNILISSTISLTRNVPVKYIRPVSTLESTTEVLNKKLANQLEEALFRGQNSSVKKTVDFVIERITSLCVKNICNNIVPSIKKEALELYEKHLEKTVGHIEDPNLNKNKKDLIAYANELSEKCYKEFKEKLNQDIKELCKEKCDTSLNSLLSHDIHQEVKNTCVLIAFQESKSRIDSWCQLHVTSGVFVRDLLGVMETFIASNNKQTANTTYKLPIAGRRGIQHDPEVISPVTLMIEIRKLLWDILDGVKLSKECTFEYIEKTKKCFKYRCDLNNMAKNQICKLFLDLYLFLGAYQPELLTLEVTKIFVNFWKNECSKDQLKNGMFFGRILCPRNIELYEQSENPELTWETCTNLIRSLLEVELLSREQFQNQAITIFRINIDEYTLNHFNKSLQSIIEEEKRRKPVTEEFIVIIDWLSNFCLEEEYM